MNEKSKVDGDTEIEDVGSKIAADDAVFDGDYSGPEYVAETVTGRRGASRLTLLLAVLALAVGAAALAGFLYLASVGDGGNDEDATSAYLGALSESIESNEASLRQLDERVGELASRRTPSGSDVEGVERRLAARLEALESMPRRLSSLESSFAALQGISTGVRDTWLLAEAEYYLQIANAQLQLAGNPHLAALALGLADERIRQLADPGMTGVRRALAAELQALEGIEKPDVEGVTLTLASLARVVESLPLRPGVTKPESGAPDIDAELSGVDRALASLKGAVSDVVTVRRTDQDARPLLAPEATYFLRTNVALQLQVARLALLRGERTVFRQALDDASAWLREYYDGESAAVSSALQTIEEVRNTSFVAAVPDISESLRLLRQHIEFSGATEAAEAEPGLPQ